jgi:hypothetical protein
MVRSLCVLQLLVGALVTPCIIPLALSSRASMPQQVRQPPAAPSVDAIGHWVGTYFQDNINRAYPMELTAAGSSDGFAITLDWPTLGQARTVGHGASKAGSVTWTEEQLVRSRGITLNGRYQAVPLDQDTLVGIYEHDSRRKGSFMLWRAHSADEPVGSKAQTQDSQHPNSVASPSHQLAALQREYCDALETCLEATLALPIPEQRNYYQRHAPSLPEFSNRFRALADANLKTPVAAQALEWVVQNDRATSNAYHAVEQLITDHGSSVELGRACSTLPYDGSAHAEELLERIRTQSPSPGVRGRATFALAECWMLASERQTALDAHGARLSCVECANRADGLLDEVARTYADEEYFANRTLGDAARVTLLQLRRVAIGKIAPEIDAEDLDGVRFKLSDYRGKVVVLDFWGHW